jgi:glutathione S-transferase
LVEQVFLEADMPFKKIDVAMGKQEHLTSGYQALTGTNAGLIPTLLTPSGQALYETPAIMLYLAEQHNLTELAPSVGDPLRGLFLSALFYIAGELHPHMKRHWYPSRYVAREEDAEAMAAHAQLAAFERVQTIEKRIEMSGGPYQLGPRFTLADIYLTFFCLPSTGGAEGLHELVQNNCPRVFELVRKVRARPKLLARWQHLLTKERAEFNAAAAVQP